MYVCKLVNKPLDIKIVVIGKNQLGGYLLVVVFDMAVCFQIYTDIYFGYILK